MPVNSSMISDVSPASSRVDVVLVGFSYGVRSATEPVTNQRGALPGPVPGSKTLWPYRMGLMSLALTPKVRANCFAD